MPKQVSIAKARDNLTKLVKAAEGGEAIALTRRGRTVAVLVSANAYRDLLGEAPDFAGCYRAFQRKHDLEDLDIDTSVFDGARDRDAGRDVAL
jgi:prevent-host-death family protein